MGYSELARQLVHLAVGGFALLLRVLTWWQAALAALAALVFNLVLLPRLGGHVLYRPTEVASGHAPGIVLYPLSVLLLILALPHRLDLVAAAWGILAVGDAAATLAGGRLGGPRWRWNREKTVIGTVAFLLCGAPASSFLAWWCSPTVTPPPSFTFIVIAPLVATAVAALLETMPVRLNDNLAVPLVAAAVLWALSLVSRDAWLAARPEVVAALAPALLVNGVVALAAWWARTVSPSGVAAGLLIGSVIYVGAGWGGWCTLVAAFVAASLATRLGLSRKMLLGLAEPHGGRRGAANAAANCGLAAVAAALAVSTPYREAALLAMVAALVAGASDTVASEVGKAWGRRSVLVPTLARVQPGTSGAISLEGTVAGVLAAVGLTIVAVASGVVAAGMVWVVVVAATIGSFVESALGATLEGPGILNNDLLNVLNTAVAAASALALARLVP
jgi:uncharacterized protein (TIGR00297 family)